MPKNPPRHAPSENFLASLNAGTEARREFRGRAVGSYKSCVVCSSSQTFPCFPKSRLWNWLGKGVIVTPHGPSGLMPGRSEFMTLGAMVTPVPMGCERGLTPRMRFPGADRNPNLLWQLMSASAWDTECYPMAAFLRTP